MADLDTTRFPYWRNVSDDSRFVRTAMASLGFQGDFADLELCEMRLTLDLAQHLKCAQGCIRAEMWES